MDEILRFENFRLIYNTSKGRLIAVKNMNFSLYTGDFLAVIGESGCGKSALASGITGIFPENAEASGKISYKGVNLLNNAEKYRGREIAAVMQEPMNALNPTVKIFKQLTEGIKLLYPAVSSEELMRQAKEALHSVGLEEDVLLKYPFQLSGGIKQRLLIASALIVRPKILIADEPTASLDSGNAEKILDIFKKFTGKGGALIMITHDFKNAGKYSDKTAVMYSGEFVEYGRTKNIFENPMHPYTRALLGCLPSRAEGAARLPVIEGTVEERYFEEGCPYFGRCTEKNEECKNYSSGQTGYNYFVSCCLYKRRNDL